jgi:isopentenyl diphosphate isomerase/L-lactate dehydrogenase-like FMN-dependent dehydrogenase
LTQWHNIEDLRRSAQRRLPRIFFDYIDGGAFSEGTMHNNVRGFSRYDLVQRALATTEQQDLTTSYLGWSVAAPFMLGPVGYLGLYARDGDLAAARSAQLAGIPFCLSTFSIASLADVRAASTGPLAFQLYVLDDLAICDELLDRAEALGVETVFVTVDTSVTSVRERDLRNGFRSLTRVSPALAAQLVLKPRWLASVMGRGLPSARGFDHRPDFGKGALEQAGNLSRRIRKNLAWEDMVWLRQRWTGKLVLKGILDPEDAARARDIGFDGVVVSNHGGRQLDGASATIHALPRIRQAVGPEYTLVLDGGVRRGSDVFKAIALGADAVSLGRAYAFGVAAGGKEGVDAAIAILRREIEICLALTGINSIAALRQRGRSALIDTYE